MNPLRPGGLSPYVDRSPPVIRKIVLRPCVPFQQVSIDAVSGCVNLVVEAFDRPSMPLGGDWSHSVFPPYRITWRGLFSPPWLPAGVRPSLEFDRLLDGPVGDVYAAGTRQNLRNRPGKYYFWLARNLDTEELADGVHTISVSAFDIRGNETSSSLSFTVANGTAGKPG